MTDRGRMIEEIRSVYRLNAPKIFSAMLHVRREKFVPPGYRAVAYKDAPVPIGMGQTMSQPYTVAFMTSLLKLKGGETVLEIGTGSGYQAAILARLVREVYTVEIVEGLADKARKTLKRLGFRNIQVKTGSGEWGWSQKVPFDAIIVTAGIKDSVPKDLFDQLKIGGVLVAPIGKENDKVMTKFTKEVGGRIKKEEFGIFHFVPFVEKKN